MYEKFNIKCILGNKSTTSVLKIIEDKDDTISISFEVNGIFILKSSDNHFNTLIEIRKELEKNNIKLLCKGSCINVYPSPMMFDMGNTRKAYTLVLGEEAKYSSLVDIFDDCNLDEYATIEEQKNFYNKWIFYKINNKI